jgi:ParB family chromosome partitioning protein
MHRKVLGKPGVKIVTLKITAIAASKFQPRQTISTQKMEELVLSIKEKGVIQPVLVRPKGDGYELIAGERRLRAAKKLGFTQVPAIVKEVEDVEALQLSLIENIQREELNPLEEAQAFQRLITEFGYTQEKIAQMVGKSLGTVSNTLRLLKLPEEIQTALRQGLITMGHARTILGVKSLAEQDSIFRRTISQHLSVREVEGMVSRRLGSRTRRKVLRQRDPHLVALEEQIQHIVGTKVKILAGRKRGRIILEYYSLDDLERIIKLLKSIR